MNVGLNAGGEESRTIALEGLPFRPHKELLKIPGDVISIDWTPYDKLGFHHQAGGVVIWVGKLVLQVGKDRVGVLAIHLTFLAKYEIGFK